MPLMSIKFLYQNPIGRALTRNRLSKKDREIIQKAKDDSRLAEDLLLAQYVDSIPEAIRFKGILLHGYLVYAKVLRQIEHFEVRPDDVWLCSYPKSGLTWTESILSLIFCDGDLTDHDKIQLAKRVPHLEVGKPLGHLKWLRSIDSPRLLATHLNAQSIPEQLQQGQAKIIYIVRNVKDNAVSYYYHHQMSNYLGKYSGTFDDFLQLYAQGKLVYGDWFEHVKGYWQLARKHPDSVLVISYEELQVNLKAMIEIISRFVGRQLSPERIEQIEKRCMFDQMRSNAMCNREKLPVPDLFDMSETHFMRKGIIGDWINHFKPEQIQLFDELYQDRIKAIGLRIAATSEEAKEMMQHSGRIIPDYHEQTETKK